MFLVVQINQFSEWDGPVVSLLGPPWVDVVFESLDPGLGQGVVGDNSQDDVLVIEFRVVGLLDQMDSHSEIGKSHVVSAEELSLVFRKVIL